MLPVQLDFIEREIKFKVIPSVCDVSGQWKPSRDGVPLQYKMNVRYVSLVVKLYRNRYSTMARKCFTYLRCWKWKVEPKQTRRFTAI